MGGRRSERGWVVGLAWAAVVAGAGAFVCSPLLTCLFGWTPTLLLVGACLAALGVVICLALLLLGQRPPRVGTGLLVGTAWLLLGGLVFLPFALAARERPHGNRCSSNLKQIGYACHLYADDRGGTFPPRLEATHPEYISDATVYVCPTRWKAVRIEASPRPRSETALHSQTCYCYVSGLRKNDNPEFVLAFDEEWNHGGDHVNVFYVGDHVKALYVGSNVVSEDAGLLHDKLAKQKAWLAAKGREMKIIRPSWSRWPERPEYPVTFWYESRLAHALLAAGALAAVVMPALFILRRRRRARGTVSDT